MHFKDTIKAMPTKAINDLSGFLNSAFQKISNI